MRWRMGWKFTMAIMMCMLYWSGSYCIFYYFFHQLKCRVECSLFFSEGGLSWLVMMMMVDVAFHRVDSATLNPSSDRLPF